MLTLYITDAIRAPPPLSKLSHCQWCDSRQLPVLDDSSWWFLLAGWCEGWRPSDKEGYRGHNMAAPLSQGIKVGQSVPWMISNSTFWGPIHWKYIYTHALSYIGRKGARNEAQNWCGCPSAGRWFETMQQARRREETITHMIWSNIAEKWCEAFISGFLFCFFCLFSCFFCAATWDQLYQHPLRDA